MDNALDTWDASPTEQQVAVAVAAVVVAVVAAVEVVAVAVVAIIVVVAVIVVVGVGVVVVVVGVVVVLVVLVVILPNPRNSAQFSSQMSGSWKHKWNSQEWNSEAMAQWPLLQLFNFQGLMPNFRKEMSHIVPLASSFLDSLWR